MRSASLAGLDRRGLRLLLGLFFIALALPSALLIRHAYSQLKWSAFHQQQVLAEEMASSIDARFTEVIGREEARSFTDYSFLVVAGNPAQNFVQRSTLAAYPVAQSIPGLIGYFQVDANGAFSTPLLPLGADATSYGVSAAELAQRQALQDRIMQILSENRLVPGHGGRAAEPGAAAGVISDAPEAKDEVLGKVLVSPSVESIAAAPPTPEKRAAANAQASFDELAEGKVQDKQSAQRAQESGKQVAGLKLDATRYDAEREAQLRRKTRDSESDALRDQRATRKESSALPETPVTSELAGATHTSVVVAQHVRMFESDIDPFALGLLDSGQFVLFRNAWRDGQRYIQGLLVEQRPFLTELAGAAFTASALARTSDLVVADQGQMLSLYGTGGGYETSAAELQGTLLYQTRLSAPLNDLELIFSVHDLPPGPGAGLVSSLAAILTLVLCGGFYLMYRLGSRQIALARQQQDFVSAVSHELKTPLTSIRMYGEMLRAGWGSEEQKRGYYDYIYDESERLSRLINNVLQLARMNRNELPLVLKPVTGAELTDSIRSKVSAQIERAGFTLDLRCEPGAEHTIVQVDLDAVLQIVINLVDNAIKFSAKATEKRIDILCRSLHDATLLLSVRDYGPGVPKDQTRRIFELFYRSENELTRETVGTGIGLALVHQLARAMRAQVDVLNREPGAEFRVIFPA